MYTRAQSIFLLAGEFSLLSDGSSPNTSAGNTPDSGDALDESTDSGVSGPASLPPTLSASSTASSLSNNSVEKRSVRELAASLNKSKSDRKENGKWKQRRLSAIFGALHSVSHGSFLATFLDANSVRPVSVSFYYVISALARLRFSFFL